MTYPTPASQHRYRPRHAHTPHSTPSSPSDTTYIPRTQRASSHTAPRIFRGDIQALRAFAVSAVIFNHLWPHAIPGGFIGVDIFFVISGFLISTHLLKDTLSGKKINLLAFYSRRVRRLLPAAFLVLTASTIAVLTFVPYDRWYAHLSEILASAAYSENIFLAVQAVDYHAIGHNASIAQHYWSLSVEEQFYFIWPLLLMGCMLAARQLGASILRISTYFVGGFTAIFLSFSVWFTAYSPAQAYFVTPVRFWEFGIGALTALAVLSFGSEKDTTPPQLPTQAHTRIEQRTHHQAQRTHQLNRARIATLAWLVLIISLWVYSPALPFPSATALIPVLATAVLIIVGTATPVLYLDTVTSQPAIQWIGNISYSLYLWHWPLIVIAPFALKTELNWWHKILILLATLVLAGLTKPLVEDHGLRWTWLASSYTRTFALMALIMTLFAASTTTATLHAHTRIEEEHARIAAEQAKIAAEQEAQRKAAIDCIGPGALQNPNDCANVYDKPLTTLIGEENNYYLTPPDCHVDSASAGGKFEGTQICDFRSNPDSHSRTNTIMLVGDSHADQWKWPMYEIAKKHHLRLEVLVLGGCPVRLLPTQTDKDSQSYQFGQDCTNGVLAINSYIDAHPPQRILQSQYAKTEPLPAIESNSNQKELYQHSFTALWKHWHELGIHDIFIIADTPYNDAVRDLNCVNNAENPAIDCRVERTKALGEDYLYNVVRAGVAPTVKGIDFTDAFCDTTYCYAAAGQMLVYFDPTHLNRQYALKLTSQLEKQLGYTTTTTSP